MLESVHACWKGGGNPLLNRPYQDSQVVGGSPWWVVTLKLFMGDGLGFVPNSFGPYTCSFEILFFLFCSLMDAWVCSIPGLEVFAIERGG